MLKDVLTALQPALEIGASYALEVIFAAMAGLLWRYTKIKIDEKHLHVLHSAAMTGLRVSLEAGLSGAKIKEAAISYIKASAPDAVKALAGSNDAILWQLVQAKLNELNEKNRLRI